jgi:cytochrome c556
MNRKWTGVLAIAALVAAGGLGSGLSRAQDQEKHKETDTPLGKIMEKVQKHNIAITKATRNAAQFKKGRKDVEKSATELAKLAKQSKPLKDAYLKNAANESDPSKKWDEIMDAFAKTAADLADAVAKDGASQKVAKDKFQTVKKSCSDCHTVFRVEKDF